MNSIDLLLKENKQLGELVAGLEKENAVLRNRDKYANVKIVVSNDLINDKLCVKFQNKKEVLAVKAFSIKELENIIKQLKF